MIRITELAQNLKVSKPTIYTWIDAGMPVYYVGKIPFFDMDEVEKWMKDGNRGGE